MHRPRGSPDDSTGAKTSTFYEKDVAASTTAMGRKLLNYAKAIIEGCYVNKRYVIDGKVIFATAEYVYGDTDSVFFKFNLTDEQGEKIIDEEALKITIKLAKEAGKLATSWLKEPHDLEYEKTFYPYILVSKKKYVGNKYEENPKKYKQISMGIVLKRRDNAPILKLVYGNIIDSILSKKDIQPAINYLRTELRRVIEGKFNLDLFIITSAIKGLVL